MNRPDIMNMKELLSRMDGAVHRYEASLKSNRADILYKEGLRDARHLVHELKELQSFADHQTAEIKRIKEYIGEDYPDAWKIMIDVIETGKSETGNDRLMCNISRSSAVNFAEIIRKEKKEIQRLKGELEEARERVDECGTGTAQSEQVESVDKLIEMAHESWEQNTSVNGDEYDREMYARGFIAGFRLPPTKER